ncbi:MAG: TonB-dependent receptor [Acidobacteriota bacterium]
MSVTGLLRLTILFAFPLLLTIPGMGAQSQSGEEPSYKNGQISGAVRDPSNALIPAVHLSLLSAQQIKLATTESDEQGQFHFSDIPPGSYVIVAEHRDFSARQRPVIVQPSKVTDVRFVLEVSHLTDQITVAAETGTAEDPASIPQQMNIISDSAITMRATAVLAQVAEKESGLSLQRTSPTIGAVLVRGLTEVGVYVDGIRYTNSTQRGGINTFFNLNEPTVLQSVEVLRGPNAAQYGSDSLGGVVYLRSQKPVLSTSKSGIHGKWNNFYNSADNSFGGNLITTFSTGKLGILLNAAGRRINTLRPAHGIDTHAAVTRFLGLQSNILGERLPDTAFSQYSGTLHTIYSPTFDQQFSLRYQRSQQDGGKRYDQLLGGDGNLVADLRNLMMDFGYLRYTNQVFGIFDTFSTAFSYNSLREERVNQGGQGNPLGDISHNWERTSSFGFSFYLDKMWPRHNSFLLGGDLYHDRVYASSYALDPVTDIVTPIRPRVPHGARYTLSGIYLQDSLDAIPGRLRISGSLRYNVASYRSRAADSPLVEGKPLFPDDSLHVGDISGRAGAVLTLADGLYVAFNYSRGFRAPNITNLGSLGLVGVGFQVSATDVAGMDATIGTTADENAVSTGVSVQPLRSEISNNYDLSIRLQRGRIRANITGYIMDYGNTIVRQSLILPRGSAGMMLGPNLIESQNDSGAVFVSLSPSPVLVQVNYGETRLKGLEFSLETNLAKSWKLSSNYTYIHAKDKFTGLPPNLGGGGIPPQTLALQIHYQPPGKRFWIAAHSTLAGRQERLSSLDLSDRRTGATRSRTNIQNFFRRGARAYGLTGPGLDGQFDTSDDILLATGETLEEVQARVLGSSTSAPLFAAIPGYAIFSLQGGYDLNEGQKILVDFTNITDKNYRAPGWGIEGSGRSLRILYQIRY